MSATPYAELLHKGERLNVYRPDVVILPTPEEVGRYAAQIVQEQIETKPDSIITYPTGRSPVEMNKRLVQAGLDWSRIRIKNLDEYWRIDPRHPASYDAVMRRQIIDYINILPQNWEIPNGMAEDPDEEAARFEQVFKEFGPVNLAILGIGPKRTCHMGFNERGSQLDSRTRYMLLDPETRDANAPYFANPNDMPAGAITQGVATILEAERIILLALGEHKAEGIYRTLVGEIGSDAPASFLRYHPQVTFILDQGAASMLSPEFRSSI